MSSSSKFSDADEVLVTVKETAVCHIGNRFRQHKTAFKESTSSRVEPTHSTDTNYNGQPADEPYAYNGIPVYPSVSARESQPNTFTTKTAFYKFSQICIKYMRFIGPGAMTAVAYIDAGNFSSSVSSGAQYKYHLLFIMFISSCIAVFLQVLAIRLGSVSGRDLAQLSREHFPRWLNWILYIFAEIAIIATDIAEVVGTAIALNVLFHIPLIAGVILTIVDVLIILSLYRSGKSVKFIYYFEYGVAALVLGVVVCFAIQLARMPPTPASQVFKGFIPSSVIFQGGAMYSACSILGATVMPHSLYLGSSIVKPRLYEKDINLGNIKEPFTQDQLDDYRPSIQAINYSLNYSVTELCVSLFTFALFVNAAILIVAGTTLYGTPDSNSADLYAIYDSLCRLLSKGSGILFMVALLLSGQSAGIVCTIAGQIVCEGHFDWKFQPWVRRVFTRCLAIIPCLVVSASVGKSGIGQVLNASQVALSILLPFLVLPLVYFTSVNSIMTIGYCKTAGGEQKERSNPMKTVEKLRNKAASRGIFREGKNSQSFETEATNRGIELGSVKRSGINVSAERQEELSTTTADSNNETYREFGRVGAIPDGPVSYTNNWAMTIAGIAVWIFISLLNVYLIVQLGRGNST